MSLPSEIVLIGLGSNLGDSVRVVKDAIRRLSELTDHPIQASSLWRTSPVECPPDSPLFVNALAAIRPRPDENPHNLLEKLKRLEAEFGRAPKKILNEPRSLDLDLIAFGRRIMDTETLILPHPRARVRGFVLAPLAELDGDYVFPGQTSTAMTLLAGLDDKEILTRLNTS